MIGSLMICVSVVVLLVGVAGGILMGITENFALGPAHAHLNLVGGALLFLFGLYYRVTPAAGQTRLAWVQGTLHIIGGILFPVGVGITIVASHAYMAIPVVGSLLVLLAMALFVVVVFRTERSAATLASTEVTPPLQT